MANRLAVGTGASYAADQIVAENGYFSCVWEGEGGGEQVWLLARAWGDFIYSHTPGSVGERFDSDFDSWLGRGLAGRFDSWLGCEEI